MNYYIYNGELYHYGVKGQKWGIRRYQNPDGSLTDAGRKRLSKDEKVAEKQLKTERKKSINELDSIALKLNDTRRMRDVAVDALKNNKFGTDEKRVQTVRYLRVMLDRELDDLVYAYRETANTYVNKYGQESYDAAKKRFFGGAMRYADEYVRQTED